MCGEHDVREPCVYDCPVAGEGFDARCLAATTWNTIEEMT